MELFVFEPHEWVCCGGAIGVIASSFEEAVNLIIEEDKKRCSNCEWFSVDRLYYKKYFAKTPTKFRKDSVDQWLLTSTTKISSKSNIKSPVILFDNWNYV